MQRFEQAIETSNDRGSGFTHEIVALLSYYFEKIDIQRAEVFSMVKDCEDWENFEQKNILVALNVLFVSYDSEEIKLVYKSNYNKRKNQVILLMINDKVERYCYFAVKNLLQLKAVRIKV